MLTVPHLLGELLAKGRWPRDAAEATAQNLRPLVTTDRVQRLAPEEDRIYLLPPPFNSVREKSEHNHYWKSPMADPGGIDFDLALDIADFGLGSDAPILLDYRANADNPRVIRLRWQAGMRNQWVLMSPDFQSFVDALGL
jgi:hypothetical protein